MNPWIGLVLFTALAWAPSAASAPVIPVSPPQPGPPEQVVNRGSETNPDRAISAVSQAALTVLLPDASRAVGTGIVICPGGGYTHLAIDREGFDVARWLNGLGIAAFLLKYRLPLPPGSRQRLPLEDAEASARFAANAIEDARTSLRLMRTRAAEFHIRADRVGLMGFSAGGHLAAMAAMRGDDDARPNFLALIYPALPVGLKPDERTPTVFLAQADNDHSAPVDNTVLCYLALRKARIPAELHIYASGSHGFGVRRQNTTSDGWTLSFERWLRELGFLAPRQADDISKKTR